MHNLIVGVSGIENGDGVVSAGGEDDRHVNCAPFYLLNSGLVVSGSMHAGFLGNVPNLDSSVDGS